MLQIVMVICLTAAPGECREERLTLTTQGLDPGQCMYSSPPLIARWQAMHRKWKVASWKCAFAGVEKSA